MASSRAVRSKSSRNSSPAVRSTRSSAAPESIHVQQRGKEALSSSIEVDEGVLLLQPSAASSSHSRGAGSAGGTEGGAAAAAAAAQTTTSNIPDIDGGDTTTPAQSQQSTITTDASQSARESTPSQRVKLRVKEWRPPGSEGKDMSPKDNGPAVQGGLGTVLAAGKESAAARPKRNASPLKASGNIVDERPTRQRTPSRKSAAEHSATTAAAAVKQQTPPASARTARAVPDIATDLVSPTGLNGRPIPSSATREGREAFRNIVEAAVERSRVLGNELLGLALRRLFEESFYNKRLAHLLDAVLAQRPTPEEAHEFQSHVKAARKKIKAENPQASSGVPEADSKPSTPIIAQHPPTPTPKAASVRKSPSKRPQRSSARNTSVPADSVTRTSTRTRANGRLHETTTATKDDTSGSTQPPPAKRQRRSGSMSSTSSLSSAHSYELENDLKTADDVSLAAKNRGLTGARPPTTKGLSAPRKSGIGVGGKRPLDEESIDQERLEKKRRLAKTFTDYTVHDSHLRNDPKPTPRPLRTGASNVPYGSMTAYGEPEAVSPASSQGDFLIPPPPGAGRTRGVSSRGATPTALGRPRKEDGRRTARIKVSPIKKRPGPNAGPGGSRMLRERDTFAAQGSQGLLSLSQSQTQNHAQSQAQGHFQRDGSVDGSDSNDGDNQDFCSACSGSGELLCCDGCVRSFHFQCLDPPGDPASPPEGEWFCYVCAAKRDPQLRPPRGLYAPLEHRLHRQNPRAFELSAPLREYFEGVKTGEDGEYEEISLSKPKPIRGIGYDDHPPDNTKLKDAKGNVILCFACGKSAEGKREIIACDHCTLKWHLDCLDPPLANAPLKDPLNRNRPRYAWMCPAHAPEEVASRGRGGRVHKLRRPKNARVVDAQLSRGLWNCGIVEIENEPSEEEVEAEEGVVYRVTEKSIKLDFIDRVHRMREEATAAAALVQGDTQRRLAREADAAVRARNAFNTRNLVEQSAALSLAQLAEADPTFEIGGDQVHLLINELVANAPEEILTKLHTSCPTPVSAPAIKPSTPTTIIHKQEPSDDLATLPQHVLLDSSAVATKPLLRSALPSSIPANSSTSAQERRRVWLLLQELVARKLREEDVANGDGVGVLDSVGGEQQGDITDEAAAAGADAGAGAGMSAATVVGGESGVKV